MDPFSRQDIHGHHPLLSQRGVEECEERGEVGEELMGGLKEERPI